MATRDGAESACANPNPIVDGRKANVNLAYLGAKPRNRSQPCECIYMDIQGQCNSLLSYGALLGYMLSVIIVHIDSLQSL